MRKTTLFAAIGAAIGLALCFAGCKAETETHEHTFAEEWTSDAEYHWHKATCGHTDEVSGKAAHTFGGWTVKKEPTESEEGAKERACSVCEYKETDTIAKLEHTHTFAEGWTSDAEYHWHEATCGHTDEVSGKAAHTFGEWTVTKEATESEEGSKERTCSVCAYKETESISPEGFVLVTMADKSKLLVQTTEMTQKMYEAVMGENPSEFKDSPASGETQELRPVENVSWYDAIYFCNKKSVADGLTPVYAVDGETDVTQWSYTPHKGNSISGTITQVDGADGWRLPTKDEWQYAAKGGEKYTYAGSGSIDDVAWYSNNSGNKTHEVAKKNANAYGLYDMSGNVSEWCWDADNSDFRCSWGSSAGYCEVSYRNYYIAYYCMNFFGFRLVRSL